MATKTQRKRKFQRRRAHAVLTRGRPGLIAFTEQHIAEQPLQPHQKKTLLQLFDEIVPPKRAKCPACGFSQKVRKDGSMSRHDVYIGDNASQCAGTGMKWNDRA